MDFIRFLLLLVFYASLGKPENAGPLIKPEAYFNGSSYLRLQTALSLKKKTGLNFRTCQGGILFSQQQNNDFFMLSVTDEGVAFDAKTAGKTFKEEIEGRFLDNRWHIVYLQYNLGNVTITVDGYSPKLIANSTYQNELLTSPSLYNEGAAILLIGKQFNGCLREGPSLVFNSINTSAFNVVFGDCPFSEDACVPRENDFCLTKPCMGQGTCINGQMGYTCSCWPRYTGKNCEIDTGDPCKKNPPVCRNNGVCTSDNSGEYTCTCPQGFTGKHCENELKMHSLCKNDPCLNSATCIDNGKVTCLCPLGFTGQFCELNSDDCITDPCKNGGICIDGFNNFTCDCTLTGYTGRICDVNINECLTNPCLNQGTCFDMYGGYLCQCLPGYEGTRCEHDQCLSSPCINQGSCSIQSDGYRCDCLPGFSGENCEISPCSTRCPPYADCIEEDTGVECLCKPEYPGIYPNCSTEKMCLNNPCKNGGTCIPGKGSFNCSCLAGFTDKCRNDGTCMTNTVLRYHCLCPEGWTGSTCDDRVQCVDDPCEHALNCQNYFGGYYCACEPGWTGLNCDVQSKRCSSNLCLNGATCNDQVGVYSCLCASGFTGNFCQFKDAGCASTPCLNGGVCIDSRHGYYCNCTEQWTGTLCDKPYDPCDLKPCLNNATCIALSSTRRNNYTCNCLPGFRGDRCEVNVDNCVDVTCPVGEICVNVGNHYECRCPPGYAGENCTVDLDPCAKEQCRNGGTCEVDTSTHRFFCICPAGYTGPRCDIDIDECVQESNTCVNGICVNKQGGFQCYCQPGYTGERCDLDFDECLSMPCRNNATCLNKVNNFECECLPGYTAKDCSIDINECESMPCMSGSTCKDGVNNFTCICPAGLTGRICDINIDDCESSPCLNGAQCIDGLNNYTCNCSDTGYTGPNCEMNIDDCVGDPCQNGALCVDKVKDYQCNCHAGYTGKNCEKDINECENNPCGNYGFCLQRSNQTLYLSNFADTLNVTLPEIFQSPFNYSKAAGYECYCKAGFSGINCEVNINECESSPCFEGTCVDQINGYFCECAEGFEGEHCDRDIDECERYRPCDQGTCIDKRADYYCDCKSNYGGKNCSVELTGCLDTPCQHNGSCKPYLINEVDHRYNCTCPNGFHGQKCEKISTMSLSGISLIMINTTREEGYDIQFRFKTTLGDGLLALGKGLTYYILELSKGRLNLHSSLLNKWEGVFIGSNLNDSQWQRVFVAINTTHLVLSANDEQTIYPITFNENYNATYTSFPLTYIGGIPNNLRKLTHGQPFLVGCTEDVHINGEWVLPEDKPVPWITFQNVDVGCSREPQCNPNPCHSGGHCTDMWRDFSCTCERPYLGHTCQYNYTAATFGYENITDSLVTVNVADTARRAVKTIVDISMFVRTRQSRGQIFYLGSTLGNTGSANTVDETYIAAQLEGGELLVRIQFNGTPEAYTVGGVKLNNGHHHLIEVIRNITLVQVKLNGTEYFRKTISATGNLDAQVLYLGGQPQPRFVRQAANDNTFKIDTIPPTASAAVTTPLSNIHFKGLIQDVQISNGSSIMVVEFFPLQVDELDIPMSFGTVTFDKSMVLEGVHSDNSCRVNPCQHNGTCENTWNDYRCICTHGFKGKDCTDLEFCQLEGCPSGAECKNLENGYECVANTTFDGKSPPFQYKFILSPNSSSPLDTLEITYRTRSWGTLLFAKNNDDYFVIFIYYHEVVVEWSIDKILDRRVFKKDQFEGQWLTLFLVYQDSVLRGGFKDTVIDEAPNFEISDFNFEGLRRIFIYGTIHVGGSVDKVFDYHSVVEKFDHNVAGYMPLGDTTTVMPLSNSIEIGDYYSPKFHIFKSDQNKTSDYFKGCVSEIRIGGYLLSFFTTPEIYSDKYFDEYFELIPNTKPKLGCILCNSVDCYNNGTCINATETYKCKCKAGFTADDCSININECESNPCQNNATCEDGIASYKCHCALGWEGTHCEDEIDECKSNPCRHGGTCLDLIGTFKCECPEDFVGKQCEAPLLITCDNKPCHEGATCQTGANLVTGNNFTCTCTEGMEGPLCDTPFCIGDKCENDGNCNATAEVPFCQCQRGFEGKFCEKNIDDCMLPTGGSPCQNGGVCIDGINRYDCDCSGTGYNGLLCEMEIDECKVLDLPCGELGLCENLPGTYKCMCKIPGKCGHRCELDDICEAEHPCVHGQCLSQCFDQADYACSCEEQFTGKNCSSQKLAASQTDEGINVLYIILPIVFIVVIAFIIGMAVLVNVARSKRATRGTYSPSAQEFCNPRVELDHVLKPPPEERLI